MVLGFGDFRVQGLEYGSLGLGFQWVGFESKMSRVAKEPRTANG